MYKKTTTQSISTLVWSLFLFSLLEDLTQKLFFINPLPNTTLLCALFICVNQDYFLYDINKVPHVLYEYEHVGDTYIGLVYLFFRVLL